MKKALIIVLFFLLVNASVLAAGQTHPVSQVEAGTKDSNLSLGTYALFANQIGIGVTSTIFKFEVSGNAKISTSLTVGNGLTVSNGNVILPPGQIDGTEIDSATVQKRVTGSCSVGNALTRINSDGTVACGSAGTPLDVASNKGLSIDYPVPPTHQTLTLNFASPLGVNGANQLTITTALGNALLAIDSSSFNKVSGGTVSADGTNITFNNNNACIKNATGVCKITFDVSGNVIIDV